MDENLPSEIYDDESPYKELHPVKVTEEPDYTTNDYYETPNMHHPSSSFKTQLSEPDEYIIEKPVHVHHVSKVSNHNKKRKLKPQPVRPADLPSFVFEPTIGGPIEDYQEPPSQNVSPYQIPFLEDDPSSYKAISIEHDPLSYEEPYPVHHFPDSEYEDPKPLFHQPKSTYRYSNPVLESPNQSEYLPAVVDIKSSYVKNKDVIYSDNYKSPKSLYYPKDEKNYPESYLPNEHGYSVPYAQGEKPVSISYQQDALPFLENDKIPNAYFERPSDYLQPETPAYYYAPSTELIPELKDIVRDPNWDVKDFSRWKKAFYKQYGGTLSSKGRGHGRGYPLPAHIDTYDKFQDSGYYKPYAPLDKTLTPTDYPQPDLNYVGATPVDSHSGIHYYSPYPEDYSKVNGGEVSYETPRPFDIKFDDWLDTSGVEAFGLQVPSDTVQQYEHPPSDFRPNAHFENLAVPATGHSDYYTPYVQYQEVRNFGTEEDKRSPFSYTQVTFKPQVSPSIYKDSSLSFQFPEQNSYKDYTFGDIIGVRKHNSEYEPIFNKESRVSSETPIQYQETLLSPYANLVPEYENKKDIEVSDDYKIKQPYLDNVHLPEITNAPTKVFSSTPIGRQNSETIPSALSSSIKQSALHQQKNHEEFQISKQVIRPNKNPRYSAGSSQPVKRMQTKVQQGKPLKTVNRVSSRKMPIKINRNKVESGSVWSGLSRLASKVIDAGHKGLLALGSETSYQYADVDYLAKGDRFDEFTGKGSLNKIN